MESIVMIEYSNDFGKYLLCLNTRNTNFTCWLSNNSFRTNYKIYITIHWLNVYGQFRGMAKSSESRSGRISGIHFLCITLILLRKYI